MDNDMVVRGMAERTRDTYLAAVKGLAKYYRRSPDQISDEEVQAYLLHLIRDRHRSWNTCHTVVHGLRFLYHTPSLCAWRRRRTPHEARAPSCAGVESRQTRVWSDAVCLAS
jgi:hypothetical protein